MTGVKSREANFYDQLAKQKLLRKTLAKESRLVSAESLEMLQAFEPQAHPGMKINRRKLEKRYVLCVKNKGYRASLEVRKIYQVIVDPRTAKRGLVRVVDESREDYLYPQDYFVSIGLPKAADKVFADQHIETMLREKVARWGRGKPRGAR